MTAVGMQTHGRVRPLDGGAELGVTLGGTEHVLQVAEAEALASRILEHADVSRGAQTNNIRHWSTQALIGQCRMQGRHNLDPEYTQFMDACAKRLRQLDTLFVALFGADQEMPKAIQPVSWLQEMIKECTLRGPALECEDTDAFAEMVEEVTRLYEASLAVRTAIRPDKTGEELTSPQPE